MWSELVLAYAISTNVLGVKEGYILCLQEGQEHLLAEIRG